jgi:squalene/oxidosqualene cyclase-like protein
LRCHTNDDGGWGLHIEGHSTVFGTAMNYIAYRLLGASADDGTCVKARQWLKKVPGAALGIPSWGKFWLATLGLYSWDGLNVIPPELWLMPYWMPLNPGRLWCHCRVVYLPMCYIYGNRFTAKETPLIQQLREELFTQRYSTIDWSKQRNHVAAVDLYTPHSRLLRIFNWIAYQYEKIHWGWLRRKALAIALDHIHHEDLTTKYIDIGPVNKAINMLAVFYSGNREAHKRHTERIRDYLWIAEDGMKMQGYNGSQLWDTAFAAQAIFESGLARDFKECLAKVHSYLDVTQVLEDVDENVKYYRHISKGAWPFSTVDHGWPISDCTSEGLKAALLYVENSKIELVPKFLVEERFQYSVNYLLSMQNKDGGWATYELTRGGQLLESLNCSEVFGDIMIDYTYVECTSACVQALHRFALLYPGHRCVYIVAHISSSTLWPAPNVCFRFRF